MIKPHDGARGRVLGSQQDVYELVAYGDCSTAIIDNHKLSCDAPSLQTSPGLAQVLAHILRNTAYPHQQQSFAKM